jgi:ribulose-phosphate 3-epimerase
VITRTLRPAHVQIAPSILSADFARLGDHLREAAQAGGKIFHIDVMDGHFVPNITFGPLVVEAIARQADLSHIARDVHLMISNPDAYLEAFAKAGATMLTVHVETCPHLHRTLSRITDLGLRAGVALNPHTPIALIEPVLEMVDRVLVMTVNPGFGGQKLIPATLRKVRGLRQSILAGKRPIELGVDGGIDASTAKAAADAGADILVAGNAVFAAEGGCAAGFANILAALA